VHPEEVRRRLGEDLRETGSVFDVVAGDDVRPTRALEEDDRLEEVGIEAAAFRRLVDEVAKSRGPPCGRDDASGALLEEDVTEPERCGPFVGRRPIGLEGEWGGADDLAGKDERWGRLLVAAGEQERRRSTGDCERRDDQDGDGAAQVRLARVTGWAPGPVWARAPARGAGALLREPRPRARPTRRGGCR
jgi:hypothetical protein